MATPRRSPYAYCTWLTPILSGDAQCEFSAWVRAHFKITEHEGDRSVSLAGWTADHAEMVRMRAEQLRAEGWSVWVEDQNKFTLRGTAIAIGGKPDIVATREDAAACIDCKTGRPRKSDVQQVLFYLLALPFYHPAVKGKQLRGELQYKDGARLAIGPEQLTDDVRARISDLAKRVGGSTPLARVPSPAECRFCKVGPADCQDRIDEPDVEVAVQEWF